MEFWDTFWATMWGALAGAAVGAVGSWLFALDLRRRAKEESDRTRLDTAVAEVVLRLGEFGGAVQAFAFSLNLPNVNAASPHIPRQRLLSAITVALMAAEDDDEPLHATFALVVAQDDKTAIRRGIEYEHAARILVQWRRGRVKPAEAADLIDGGPPSPARPEDAG